MTNVPAPQWLSTGILVPTQAAVLAGVQADLQAAFGGNMNPALNTPQGQLATSLAAMIFNCYSALAFFANNVNPLAATDQMQDAIGFIYGLTRNSGAPTTVQCVCTGLNGTVIPIGSQAQDSSGNIYTSTQAGTISGGSVTLEFENNSIGPIPCPANTVTQIYQSITGWNSVNNPSTGTLGANIENQQAYAARMQSSVAVNAQGSLGAIYGTIAALAGVISVYCIENDTGSPVSTGSTNYSVAANSIYVAVAGSAVAAAVAQAIFTKKSPGCNTNGNQSVTVYDTSYPEGSQPAYTIKYNVPSDIQITFLVTLANSVNLPSNINTLIQNAILALFEEGNGTLPGAGIASLIYAANYFATVLSTFVGLPLLSITLGTQFSGTANLTATSTTMTVVTPGAGMYLSAGCLVTDSTNPTALAAGTYIVQQLSGTPGGAGTYQLSVAAVASHSGDTVVSATGNAASFQAGIDQLPQLAVGNISIVT